MFVEHAGGGVKNAAGRADTDPATGHGTAAMMNTLSTLGTQPAAYAAAPQQAGFAPPAAVDLPAPDEVPRENGESGGEPAPDLFGRPGDGRGPNPEAAPGPVAPGAAYGADGHALAASALGLRLNLLAA